MGRLTCAFAIISFVRHNHPITGGNVILCDFVRPNRYSTEERHSQVKNEARCKTTHLKSWCEKHITKPIARLLMAEQREGFVEGDGLRDVESAISGAT